MSEFQSDYYSKHYWNIHYKGLLGAFTKGYHKKIERGRNSNDFYENVLEIGGGTGEHIEFVRHSFSIYTLLDISESPDGLRRIASDPRSLQFQFVLADASSVPFEDSTFDRVVSTCVLHHVSNLERTLTEVRRVAKNGAVIDLYVPCDPGMMYRWIRHWTSHLKQKSSMDLSWTQVKYLWALEHQNHYLGIMALIKGVFAIDNIRIARYPSPWLSWNFNLFSVVTVKLKKQ
jgi:phosphatidylethanolamine/phosphatidyl-N-methylethanolamine N-methyltransferase